MSAPEIEQLYAWAHAAAIRILRIFGGSMDSWRDDCVQHILCKYLEDPTHEHGPITMRRHAIGFFRELMHTRRTESRRNAIRTEMPCEIRDHDGSAIQFTDAGTRAIALWRIQRVWPTLTDLQRRSVLDVLTDDPRDGDRRSSTPQTVDARHGSQLRSQARHVAYRRINRMHEYTRVASRRTK